MVSDPVWGVLPILIAAVVFIGWQLSRTRVESVESRPVVDSYYERVVAAASCVGPDVCTPEDFCCECCPAVNDCGDCQCSKCELLPAWDTGIYIDD
jgi:hypothetical protein